MKSFALLILAAAVQAVSISQNGMSDWAQNREDGWRDAVLESADEDAKTYGGARQFNPDWAVRQQGTWGVDFGPGVNGNGKDDEVADVLETDGETDDDMTDDSDDTDGESRGVDSAAWREAKQAWRDSRQSRDELEALSSSGRADQREIWRNARPSVDDYRM